MNAHERFVRGVTFAGNHTLSADTIFVSTGDDQKVCIWSLNGLKKQFREKQEELGITQTSAFNNYLPQATYASKNQVLNVDHSWSDDLFATSGSVVQIWSYDRSAPVQVFDTWTPDTVTKLKFNPTETNILASVCNDRSLIFYDLRGKSQL